MPAFLKFQLIVQPCRGASSLLLLRVKTGGILNSERSSAGWWRMTAVEDHTGPSGRCLSLPTHAAGRHSGPAPWSFSFRADFAHGANRRRRSSPPCSEGHRSPPRWLRQALQFFSSTQLTGAGPRSAAPSDPLTLGQLGPLGPPAGRGRAFYLVGCGSPRLRRIIRDLPRLLCPRGKRRGPRVV